MLVQHHLRKMLFGNKNEGRKEDKEQLGLCFVLEVARS